MPGQVAIIHGWSDSSESFRDLRDFLGANGFQVTEVWLADYISMQDDVRIPDVAQRMQAVLTDWIEAGKLTPPFDMIVHSTGGLVAREWIARFYPDGTSADGKGKTCPVKRIVMLAPANFGSRLASAGKSFVGRIVKGHAREGFQTGTEMLRGLELASPYQWDLAQRDLLDPAGESEGPYGGDKIWPFVIVGTRGYTELFMRVANENGADGTVRACAANMNCVGLTIDFSAGRDTPSVVPWRPRNSNVRIPFAIVADRNHATVHQPMADSGSAPELRPLLGRLILEALGCDSSARYGEIAGTWWARTEALKDLALEENDAQREALLPAHTPPREAFHQYMQVIVAVVDDQGQPVDDYFMEFFPDDKEGDAAVYFQREVLENIHVNSVEQHFRCLYVDRTDLMLGYYKKVPPSAPHVVAMSLSAAPIGANIRYFDTSDEHASGHLIVHREDDEQREKMGAVRLRRNVTHLVKIVIPRQPMAGVFTLSQPA